MGFFSAFPSWPPFSDTHRIPKPMKVMDNALRRTLSKMLGAFLAIVAAPLLMTPLMAQAAPQTPGGEANLIIPDLNSVQFFGIAGGRLLLIGLVVCALGLLFGLTIYTRLKNMPVHFSMREVSELIYETCKTYLVTQGKFILILEVFIGAVIALYFGVLLHFSIEKVVVILLFSLIGIAGSYGVAWFGIRVNTFANSRTAFAALRGRHEHRHAAHFGRARAHAVHPALHPAGLRRAVFHRFRDR
jgi:K(+)-stimulated pyrophosphate-energized sodium pump